VPTDDEQAFWLALQFFSFPVTMEVQETITVRLDVSRADVPQPLSTETYYRFLAYALARRRSFNVAERACQHAIRVAAEPDPGLDHQLGIIYMNLDKPSLAEKAFRAACDLSPHDALFHACLADAILSQEGEDVAERARKEVETAFRLDRNCSVAYAVRADLHDRAGQTSEACADYRQSVRLDSSEPRVQMRLGILLAQSGHYDEAIEALRKSLDLDPGNAYVMANLGSALRDADNKEEAVAYYQQAVTAAPLFWEARGLLGETLLELGRYEECVRVYSEAFEHGPGFAVWDYNMGVAYLRLGRRDEAQKAWRKAFLKDPTQAQLRGMIGRLERDPNLGVDELLGTRFSGTVASAAEKRLVVCPQCHRRTPAEWWVCVNAYTDPSLRAQLLSLVAGRAFNRNVCRHCDTTSMTPATVVYVDEGKSIKILCFRPDYSANLDAAMAEYRQRELLSYASRPMLEHLLEGGTDGFMCVWGYDELWETVLALETRSEGRAASTVREALRGLSDAKTVGDIEKALASVIGLPPESGLAERVATVIHVAWTGRKLCAEAVEALVAVEAAGLEWLPAEKVQCLTEKFRILTFLGKEDEALNLVLRWRESCADVSPADLQPLLVTAYLDAVRRGLDLSAQQIRQDMREIGAAPPPWVILYGEAFRLVDQGQAQAAQAPLAELLALTHADEIQHLIHHMAGRAARLAGITPVRGVIFGKRSIPSLSTALLIECLPERSAIRSLTTGDWSPSAISTFSSTSARSAPWIYVWTRAEPTATFTVRPNAIISWVTFISTKGTSALPVPCSCKLCLSTGKSTTLTVRRSRS